MKKTIVLGQQELTLVSSGATPIFYRNEFGRDFFADFTKFLEFATQASEAETDTDKMKLIMDPDNIQLVQRMAYVYAKNADQNIKPIEQWFAEFEEFPVFDVLGDLVDLAMTSISTKKA